jgi:hypothetical protein
MMEKADSSAITVYRSKQMMKSVAFGKTTVYSSVLTMQPADSSKDMAQISKADQRYIAKGSNTNIILPLFCLVVTKCESIKYVTVS